MTYDQTSSAPASAPSLQAFLPLIPIEPFLPQTPCWGAFGQDWNQVFELPGERRVAGTLPNSLPSEGSVQTFCSDSRLLCDARSSKRVKKTISFKRRKSSSRYKGVLFVKGHNKWRAQLCFEGKKVCIGSFSTELEAAKARDKKVKQLFGETSTKLLNFPRVGSVENAQNSDS